MFIQNKVCTNVIHNESIGNKNRSIKQLLDIELKIAYRYEQKTTHVENKMY